jgi:rod shape determining protein RodA
MQLRREYKSFDFVLAGLVIVLCVFGAVMIFSVVSGYSDSYKASTPGVASVFTRHIVFMLLGLGMMAAAAFVDFRFIARFWIAMYALNIILLLLVYYIGRDTDDVTRWLRLSDFGLSRAPSWLGIQPSEFCKLFSIIYLSKAVDKYKDRLNEPLVLIPIVAAALLPIALIVIQPSLSAGIVPLVILVVMLFVGKINYKYIIVTLLVLGVGFFLLYYDLTAENPIFLNHIVGEGKPLSGYQLDRIRVAFNLEVDDPTYMARRSELVWQTDRSIQAIQSGGLFGNGLFGNKVYIYSAHSDFVFAVIASEFGFAGCAAVILIMLVIVAKCLYIAHKTPVFYGKLIAASVAAMLAFQTFINISVATGIMPNTGMTLPFISAGGSSLWICFMAVGLVLNIGMTKQKGMFE